MVRIVIYIWQFKLVLIEPGSKFIIPLNKFQNDSAKVRKLLLKLANLLESAPPFILRAEPLNALYQKPTVP